MYAMIEVDREVEVGDQKSSRFGIDLNGKAFKVLINSIYADKIQSIVREIWSNALDGHIMAGKENIPFEVQLPSYNDPVFSVKDFGIGLSPEDIENIYKTLFRSTKEQSDFVVGRYGLGSKTPFAYTDSFQVTSVFDGVKTFYTAMIASDGIPDMHTMGQEKTEEINGVTVSFPVNPADFYAFRQAAISVSLGFDVKPIITNDENFDYPDRGFEIVKGVWSSEYSSGLYAKMGPVLYPISYDAISKISDDSLVLSMLKLLCTNSSNGRTIIEFEMGTLEMSASRESLSYSRDEPTVFSIEKRIKEIVKEIKDRFEEIKEIDDYIEAAGEYVKLAKSSYIFREIASNTKNVHKSGMVLDISGKVNLSSKHSFSSVQIPPLKEKYHISNFRRSINKLTPRRIGYNNEIDSDCIGDNNEIDFGIIGKKTDVTVFVGNSDLRDKTRKFVNWRTIPQRIVQHIEKSGNFIFVNIFNNEHAYDVIDVLSNIFDDIRWVGDLPKVEAVKEKKEKEDIHKLFGEASSVFKRVFNLEDIKDELDKIDFVYNRGGHISNLDSSNFLKALNEKENFMRPVEIVVVNSVQRNIIKKLFNISVTDEHDYVKTRMKNLFADVTQECFEAYKEFVSYKNSREYAYAFEETVSGFLDKIREECGKEYYIPRIVERDENILFTIMTNYDSNIYQKKDRMHDVTEFLTSTKELKFVYEFMKCTGKTYYQPNYSSLFENEFIMSEVVKSIKEASK